MEFEKKLDRLEKIINDMENGELSLDESLKKFEQGIQLSRECHKDLSQAEQKIKKLIEDEDSLKLTDFEMKGS